MVAASCAVPAVAVAAGAGEDSTGKVGWVWPPTFITTSVIFFIIPTSGYPTDSTMMLAILTQNFT